MTPNKVKNLIPVERLCIAILVSFYEYESVRALSHLRSWSTRLSSVYPRARTEAVVLNSLRGVATYVSD